MALEMRTNCEHCTLPLTLTGEAFICTFECTFCGGCAVTLKNTCPNCSGELVRRPRKKAAGRRAVVA